MPVQSNLHFFLNWAKERIDEIDAALASLESKVTGMRADSRVKADQFLAELRNRRDEFKGTVKKQAEAGAVAWEATKAQLEAQWQGFETQIKGYLETFGKDIRQQQAVFQSQVTAQVDAWRGAADNIHAAAAELAAEHRRDIDAAVSRMRADAADAQEKLQQLARAGTESWAALNAALAETRAAFDRANHAAQEAFKRASAAVP
jgi:hypothetical protein